ncbi:hypothetical protein WQ57_11280 [Mesobacillus campisalis]|uniref:Uncharacterized protein n=1 Tax=Mesobacillus campisalis TaxID=1408103 RepID=A0A0M2SZN2_9BACI|nr:hypothetical protein WQ57_11280 [Mesobacillus campisalis]
MIAKNLFILLPPDNLLFAKCTAFSSAYHLGIWMKNPLCFVHQINSAFYKDCGTFAILYTNKSKAVGLSLDSPVLPIFTKLVIYFIFLTYTI